MKIITLLGIGLATAFLGGCSKTENAAAPANEVVQKHEHHPPHHGTPVVLGNEEYHVEFVLDAATGKLQAYMLDGELENFVRIQPESFNIAARVSGRDETMTLKAVANAATGETIGDTSLFEVQADWLKTVTNFDAAIGKINVRGKSYTNVVFNFPKGNDTDETGK